MKLPQPTGPVWNLRLFRSTVFVFFIATSAVALGFLAAGELTRAGVVAVMAALFGLDWHFVRYMTLQLERWARRAGYHVNHG